MAVIQVVDLRVNPDDRTQWVTLHANGRIDSHNCPPALDNMLWVDRPDAVAVAVHVTDWTGDELAGYTFDKQGGFWPFGGAPNIATSKPDWWQGPNMIVTGVPYWPIGIYVDWAWDPYHPGRGVALDGYGTLHAFGGAPGPFRSGHRWDSLVAVKLEMSWDGDMRAYTLDFSGGIHHDYSAVLAPQGPYWRGQNVVRDFAITDWARTGNPPSGYKLDLYGGTHAFGVAELAINGPYLVGADRARRLAVLQKDDPTRLLQVWSFGQEYVWEASTAPDVIPGGFDPKSPAATVTDTTRPMLSWAMSDAETDSQAEWEVAVFRQAFVTANPSVASNPWLFLWDSVAFRTGKDPATRGIRCPVDLDNGNYVEFVRVKDTSNLWSPWRSRAWLQAVVLPAPPTNLVVTPSEATYSAALSASTPVSGLANLVRFEFSDDAALSWAVVRGAEAVPRAATTSATDWDLPMGRDRLYRAVQYALDPAIASPPSNTAPASLQTRTYVLTSTADPALGGEVIVVGEMGWDERAGGGEFDTLSGDDEIDDVFPVVLVDGEPKARHQNLTLDLNGRPEFEKFRALKRSASVLLLRDPFGEAVYCRILGTISYSQQREEPLAGENTPLRHSHVVTIPLVEVAPPTRAR